MNGAREMEDIYDQIENGDLTEDLSIIASLIGINAVRKILKHLPGQTFYIPRITRFDSFITRYLEKNRQKNLKELATELQVSEQYLRKAYKKVRSSINTKEKRG